MVNLGFLQYAELINTPKTPEISIAYVEVKGKNKTIINNGSNAAYYILEGSGTFVIDNETVTVEAGDVVFIPRGTQYQDAGTLAMLAINTPRYDQNTVTYID